jgi:hypothetical protein
VGLGDSGTGGLIGEPAPIEGAGDGVTIDIPGGTPGVGLDVGRTGLVGLGVLVEYTGGFGDGNGEDEAGTAGVVVASGAGIAGDASGDGAVVWLPANKAVPIP